MDVMAWVAQEVGRRPSSLSVEGKVGVLVSLVRRHQRMTRTGLAKLLRVSRLSVDRHVAQGVKAGLLERDGQWIIARE